MSTNKLLSATLNQVFEREEMLPEKNISFSKKIFCSTFLKSGFICE